GACPVDDTLLLAAARGWYCPTCLACWDPQGRCGTWLAGDPSLATALVADDILEAAGLLAAADRRTCHTCRTWVDSDHVKDAAHWAAIDAAANPVPWPQVAGPGNNVD